ncbi:hypothetical protein PP175_25385 (plasmid) [Aneurinibacillus sp. Ricciae_BoGa-3]|uniref:hypothetical protein n=1 Tax=Aneurinibacillus sp. Ricciae_BoGa-3 TaxID=3022697 RepID=UPI0023400423|nr:hypothetical protein [Aneurinibacillus sp. Ricciae_BoGa-3]WCK57403.1 hypothetical protein PP175_25385 [Aneurinibacillus sp. Ricciae_BoGa-3]
MKRYVIQKGNQFVKDAWILSVKGKVSIRKTDFTSHIMDSQVFTEYDKEEDLHAWEEYFGFQHGQRFCYEEIKFTRLSDDRN